MTSPSESDNKIHYRKLKGSARSLQFSILERDNNMYYRKLLGIARLLRITVSNGQVPRWPTLIVIRPPPAHAE